MVPRVAWAFVVFILLCRERVCQLSVSGERVLQYEGKGFKGS